MGEYKQCIGCQTHFNNRDLIVIILLGFDLLVLTAGSTP